MCIHTFFCDCKYKCLGNCLQPFLKFFLRWIFYPYMMHIFKLFLNNLLYFFYFF